MGSATAQASSASASAASPQTARQAGADRALSDDQVLSNERLDGFRREGADRLQTMESDSVLVTRAMQGLRATIMGIGGAIITAFMVIVVLSEVFSLDIISQASGPFGNLTTDFVNYGTAAMSLVGIAIIVGAAAVAMNAFGGMGGR